MFGSAELRSGVVGAGILLSAIGFTNAEASGAEPVQGQNQAGVAAQIDPGAGALNRASGVERFSGPLQGVKPPVYDGAVPWDNGLSALGQGAVFGLIAGLFGGAIGMMSGERDDKSLRNALIGAGIGFAVPLGIGAAASPARVIEFSTTVQEVQSEAPPHYERHHSGKVVVSRGPYFGQVVSIPEANVPLAVNSYKTPLIPGQKITARFALDRDNHIIFWGAEAALR